MVEVLAVAADGLVAAADIVAQMVPRTVAAAAVVLAPMQYN